MQSINLPVELHNKAKAIAEAKTKKETKENIAGGSKGNSEKGKMTKSDS